MACRPVATVLAESEGFEPPSPFGPPDFESGAFSRSASSPDHVVFLRTRALCPALRSDPAPCGASTRGAGRLPPGPPTRYAHSLLHLAERVGFEPTIRCRIHAFQACAFGRSATSPGI